MSKNLSVEAYNRSYRFMQNTLNGKSASAARAISEFYNIGKENPCLSLMTYKKAASDSFNTYVAKKGGQHKNAIVASIKGSLNLAKMRLFHAKDYKPAQNEFKQAMKDLYPKTYKMRYDLINSSKVHL